MLGITTREARIRNRDARLLEKQRVEEERAEKMAEKSREKKKKEDQVAEERRLRKAKRELELQYIQQRVEQEKHDARPVARKRGPCPCCGIRPVAIANRRYGRAYYRDRCDQCYRKKMKPLPASWVRAGYTKKTACEKCRFRFKFPEQAVVMYIDGNEQNNDWSNLKTICLNCQIAVARSSVSWSSGSIQPDF